ncbi:hypothetical protein D3C80_1497280 [compost metagenome]
MTAELAARHVADVQFQLVVDRHAGGHRVAAAGAVLELHVDVLARVVAELGATRRQHQAHHGDVVADLVDGADAGSGFLHADAAQLADFRRVDDQVGGGPGATAQHHALGTLCFAEHLQRAVGVIYAATGDLALAAAAGTLAAAVLEHQAIGQRAVEDGLVGLEGELLP